MTGPPRPETKTVTPKDLHNTSSRWMEGLGSGDTRLCQDFMDASMAEQAYRAMVPSLKEDEERSREDAGKACEVPWQEMLFHGRPVPRLVCIQGERRGEDGAVPLYRHPVDEQPPVHDFSLNIIIAKVVEKLKTVQSILFTVRGR